MPAATARTPPQPAMTCPRCKLGRIRQWSSATTRLRTAGRGLQLLGPGAEPAGHTRPAASEVVVVDQVVVDDEGRVQQLDGCGHAQDGVPSPAAEAVVDVGQETRTDPLPAAERVDERGTEGVGVNTRCDVSPHRPQVGVESSLQVAVPGTHGWITDRSGAAPG